MSGEFFSQPVVCNTGPIIALARARLVRLLSEIFPAVIIPQAVADELPRGLFEIWEPCRGPISLLRIAA